MANKKYHFLLPVLFAVVLAIGLWGGFQMKEETVKKVSIINKKGGTSKFDHLMNYLNSKYVDTLDQKKLTQTAIENVLDKLDPHSFYIPPQDLENVNNSLEGKFEGIGIEFFIVNDTITVVSPISGGPSEKLGIRAGDKIVEIEDTSVAGKGITNKDVIDKLRGPKGSKVTINIKRPNEDELIPYTITRDKIPIHSVDVGYMVNDRIGYIKISRFSGKTFDEFAEKLKTLLDEDMKKLILDLRQNPGGYLGASTLLADEFLSGRKMIVYTEGKSYQRKAYKAKNPGRFEEGELAILIDEGSASASEIVAGAVQDWDRGTIIGRRSFGKGLVQEQFQMEDGSALRLTVARYHTPSGRCIQKPYGDDNQEYYREIANRFKNGEYVHPDTSTPSDSLLYTTSEGDTVYGGGGIMPDIFVPMDTSGNMRYYSKLRAKIPPFVYGYYADHKELFKEVENPRTYREIFQLPSQTYQAFLSYAEEQGIPIKEDELGELKPRITTTLKAYLGRQMWRNKGYYPVMNTIDTTFQRALKKLSTDTTILTKVQNE
jgi:carboxyl-terminal processing protease